MTRAVLVLICLAAGWPPPAAAAPIAPVPATVRLLPLAGRVAHPDTEVGGMFWCGDDLVIVPQYPDAMGTKERPLVFRLSRAEIDAVLAGSSPGPLTPRPVEVVLSGGGRRSRLKGDVPGWEGFEAVVRTGDDLVFAVEARETVAGRKSMRGWLLAGRVLRGEGGALRLGIDLDSLAPVPLPADIKNFSQEAMLAVDDEIWVLYEVMGAAGTVPQAAVFGRDLSFRRHRPCSHFDYRVTDATDLDADRRFWVIHYFYEKDRDKLKPPVVPAGPVEQLVELRVADDRIVRTQRPPLDLRTPATGPARNWEAIVRHGDGFLLMTDTYPTTLLAYVAAPDTAPRTEDDYR